MYLNEYDDDDDDVDDDDDGGGGGGGGGDDDMKSVFIVNKPHYRLCSAERRHLAVVGRPRDVR